MAATLASLSIYGYTKSQFKKFGGLNVPIPVEPPEVSPVIHKSE